MIAVLHVLMYIALGVIGLAIVVPELRWLRKRQRARRLERRLALEAETWLRRETTGRL